MGYHSYFALQVADYGMTVDEMMKLLDDALETTKPLFDGLHCFAKYELAARFKRPPPRLIPAHWLGNRWAQTWPGLDRGGQPRSAVQGGVGREHRQERRELLRLARLPQAARRRSGSARTSTRCRPASPRKKNAHASAWDIDRAGDVRSLMSVEPNEEWFDTAHHELGHIYYFLSYDRPGGALPAARRRQPRLSRGGRRAGQAGQPADALPGQGRRDARGQAARPDRLAAAVGARVDRVSPLLRRDDEPLRARSLRRRSCRRPSGSRGGGTTSPTFQGVVPPGSREGDLCDACTKTHINDDPAQYYDYALATMIKFQLHDHICTKILKQDVRACDYSGSKEVGDFLQGDPVAGRDARLADGHQGRDRRADLAARDDGVLPAAGRRAGQAQRRPGLRRGDRARASRAALGLVLDRAQRPHAAARMRPARRRCRRSAVPPPPAPPAERERGVALGLFAEDVSFSYAPLLAEIVALGATHVALVVPLYQTDGASDGARRSTPASPPPSTPSPRRPARRKRDGLEVTIFPIVRLSAPRAGRVARHAGAARSRRLVSTATATSWAIWPASPR